VSANVIYCEEAAYMDLGVFYEVIVPLMEVEGTATICISTPLGSFNFYSELTEVRDDKGKRVFNVRHIKGGQPPSWKPDEARSRVQAIYGSRTTLYRREIMGEIADEGENMAFSVAKLRKLFDKPPMAPPYVINEQTVFVAIDPNGGASASDGPGSDTAIVSFVVSEGRVVVSLFSCDVVVASGGVRADGPLVRHVEADALGDVRAQVEHALGELCE